MPSFKVGSGDLNSSPQDLRTLFMQPLLQAPCYYFLISSNYTSKDFFLSLRYLFTLVSQLLIGMCFVCDRLADFTKQNDKCEKGNEFLWSRKISEKYRCSEKIWMCMFQSSFKKTCVWQNSKRDKRKCRGSPGSDDHQHSSQDGSRESRSTWHPWPSHIKVPSRTRLWIWHTLLKGTLTRVRK